ncbi:MAG: hypothetical protein WC362_06405 [Methanoregula sp.]|jgi:hypothetical protein
MNDTICDHFLHGNLEIGRLLIGKTGRPHYLFEFERDYRDLVRLGRYCKINLRCKNPTMEICNDESNSSRAGTARFRAPGRKSGRCTCHTWRGKESRMWFRITGSIKYAPGTVSACTYINNSGKPEKGEGLSRHRDDIGKVSDTARWPFEE